MTENELDLGDRVRRGDALGTVVSIAEPIGEPITLDAPATGPAMAYVTWDGGDASWVAVQELAPTRDDIA